MVQLSLTNGNLGVSLMAVVLSLTSSSAIFIQNTKLQALDKQSGDEFGQSVAISNGYLVVGARYEDTYGTNTGAAYIYEKDNFGNWYQIQKIQASDRQATDYFGESVAISNDYIVVGAYAEDAGGSDSGAAYVYKRNAETETWDEIQKLRASDPQAHDHFGHSVAISNEYIVIGARYEDTGYGDAGSVYVYKINNFGEWHEIQKIQASDRQSSDYFGDSVAISNEYMVIGAYSEDTGASNAGAAYIFKRDNFEQWVQVQKLQTLDPQTNDNFGFSVSISNNYLVIGAHGKDTGGVDNGAAYVFEKDISTDTWHQVKKLQASDTDSYDSFGISVDISNDYLIVSADTENPGGIDNAGSAYIFNRDISTGLWSQTQKVQASDIDIYKALTSDHFGRSVAISNGELVIGAFYHDTGGSNAGAVYVFRSDGAPTPVVNSGLVRFRQENEEYMTFIDGFGFIMKSNDNTLEMYLDSTFNKVSPLNNEANCYSFESIHNPNNYMSHGLNNGDATVTLVQFDSNMDTDSASWCYISGVSDISRWYPYGLSQYYMKVDETQLDKIIVSKTITAFTTL